MRYNNEEYHMNIETIMKPAFSVIGKEGSTADGPGFIQRLWTDANAHFDEVSHLAKRDENGALVGIWGVMSDLSRSYLPWEENFTKGLYLAGVECEDEALPPEGWTKWTVPSFEYLRAECTTEAIFPEMLRWLRNRDLTLAGAVHDFTCPTSGKNYMLFPIRKLFTEPAV